MELYNVLFFGSHPDLENDDCWYGTDYATQAEALLAFEAMVKDLNNCPARDVAYIMIDGPDINKIRANPSFRKSGSDHSWQREFAMQAGMLGGCQAYNEAMGYD